MKRNTRFVNIIEPLPIHFYACKSKIEFHICSMGFFMKHAGIGMRKS